MPSSLILYESAHRLPASLRDMRDCLGAERNAAVCRELTKKFEEVTRGSLGDLAARFAERAVKGEIVVVIDRGSVAAVSAQDVERALQDAMMSMSVKEASSLVAERLGLSKRDAYQMAIRIGASR